MMQLKDRNEDSCHIQKYTQIASTAIVTILTGRVSGCLFVLSIKSTAVKKRNTGKLQFFTEACSLLGIDRGECCMSAWEHSTF